MARVMLHAEMIQTGELGLVPADKLKEALRRVRDNPEAGKHLRGELKGCQSIRVEGSENRLVYEHRKSDDTVEVLALERRRAGEAYETARKRRRSR